MGLVAPPRYQVGGHNESRETVRCLLLLA